MIYLCSITCGFTLEWDSRFGPDLQLELTNIWKPCTVLHKHINTTRESQAPQLHRDGVGRKGATEAHSVLSLRQSCCGSGGEFLQATFPMLSAGGMAEWFGLWFLFGKEKKYFGSLQRVAGQCSPHVKRQKFPGLVDIFSPQWESQTWAPASCGTQLRPISAGSLGLETTCPAPEDQSSQDLVFLHRTL